MYLISLDIGDGPIGRPVLSYTSAQALVAIAQHNIRIPQDSIIVDIRYWLTIPAYIVTMMSPYRLYNMYMTTLGIGGFPDTEYGHPAFFTTSAEFVFGPSRPKPFSYRLAKSMLRWPDVPDYLQFMPNMLYVSSDM